MRRYLVLTIPMLSAVGNVAGPAPAHAAATVTLSTAGELNVRMTAPGTARLSCAGGNVAVGSVVTAFGCAQLTYVLVNGTAGADLIDTTQMRQADFPALVPRGHYGNPVEVQGKDGADVISGGPIGEKLFGGPGADYVKGGDGADWLDGGGGDDLVRGGSGSDLISGGSGNDVVTGDATIGVDDGSDDESSGGAGTDTFHLTNADVAAPYYSLIDAPDKVFVKLTRPAPGGANIISQIYDGPGGDGIVNVDIEIAYSSSWTLNHPVPTLGKLSFVENVVPGWNLTWMRVGTVTARFAGGNDVVRVLQHPDTKIVVDAGAGTDSLKVVRLESPTTDSGAVVRSATMRPIYYSNFEAKTLTGP